MPPYFHGWRRKIGVLTLGLACVFAVGWVRSRTHLDRVTFFKYGCAIHCLTSDRESIQWFVTTAPENDPMLSQTLFDLKSYPTSEMLVNSLYRPIFNQPPHLEKHWNVGSFDISEALFRVTISGDFNIFLVNTPYWSIVIPLALLSAWLLLSKPRSNKPKESV